MVASRNWTRNELLVALGLYCQLPFGRLYASNPTIIQYAQAMGRSPSALAMKLVNIASLDPKIIATGRSGLQNASANDRLMWEEMQNDWERFAIESERATGGLGMHEEHPDRLLEETTPAHLGEDRVVAATARIGQRFFRSAVLSAYNGRCCITGLSLPSLLVASHIIPWSHNTTTRVDPRNGLLLSTLHDKAFDTGVITIDDDLTVRVSSTYAAGSDEFFARTIGAYDGQRISPPQKFEPDRDFLRYHREHVFRGG